MGIPLGISRQRAEALRARSIHGYVPGLIGQEAVWDGFVPDGSHCPDMVITIQDARPGEIMLRALQTSGRSGSSK